MRGFRMLAVLVPALVASSAADAALIFHDGYDACWNTAVTRPVFLERVRASIDGTQGCIAPQSGTELGITYTTCNVPNGCGTGVPGCPVTLQAGAFSGDLAAGHLVGPGSAADIAVPIDAGFVGSCTLRLTGVVLGYTLDYLMRTDGVDGVYVDNLAAPQVAITQYTSSNNCNSFLASLIASYEPDAVAAAADGAAVQIEPGLREDTVGQSICPLSGP
ncbi:hypothetical protein ACQQ2N_00055 [Dokdonella sp. MW10]|uniref:hypothetical protein n=1 Tax=Dokdonella sp. MW10 TaxID=2992926 RepID=UPI003F7F9A9D